MPSPVVRRWFAATALILSVTLVPALADNGDLMRRLTREADRVGRRDTGAEATGPGDDIALSDQRSRQAERIVTRAVRGLAYERLGELAQSSPGFSQFLRRLNLTAPGVTAIEAPPAPGPAGAGGRAGPAHDPASASFGLRVDAHPRIVVRGRIGSLSGSLEMPLLERELRLSVERSFGNHGRAVMRGGRSEDRGDWATVGFSLQF